jgi:hypothetical protein
LARQVSDPPEEMQRPLDLHQSRYVHLSKLGFLSMLILIGLLLALFSGLLIYGLTPQARQAAALSATATASAIETRVASPIVITPTPTPNPSATPTPNPPIVEPNASAAIPALDLPAGHYLIYEQPYNPNQPVNSKNPQNPNSPQGNLLIAPLGGAARTLNAPGYIYNQAVRPILTPDGQLLYSGSGLWLLDLFSGRALQLAAVAPGEVVTSLALSNDGQFIAWSTEPSNGRGTIQIYAGPLASPALIYQQSTADCPCFRVFDVLNSASTAELLLTDSRGSHEAVQNGLWVLPLTLPAASTQGTPVPILPEDPEQGPLLLSPSERFLLYSPNEGQVPYPTDNSVPADIAALSYANSLSVAPLVGSPSTLGSSQVVLPAQSALRSIADYHWVTTPLFAPDERSLIYVEFSSDDQPPYGRHSALYVARISDGSGHLRVSSPALLATSTAGLVELGTWLNGHTVTLYADGNLFALDIKSGAMATLVQAGTYVRAVAVVGSGRV